MSMEALGIFCRDDFMTTITKETTLLEPFNAAAKSPELLKLNLGAAAAIAEADSGKRRDGLHSRMNVSEFYAAYYTGTFRTRTA